ncbi:MAG TPA: hypothetical protein VI193_12515, partial [Acidimicrobiia bacterium]
MTTPFEISDRFTEQWSDLTPIDATIQGVEGRDHLWDDFSPEGEAARADLARSTRGELVEHLNDPDPKQAFAAKVLAAWMMKKVTVFERGKWKSDLNHIYSPFQRARDT